jgi:hypothetical protein
VGYEPKIPAFVRVKTVHALDCEATVIGTSTEWIMKIPKIHFDLTSVSIAKFLVHMGQLIPNLN